MPKPAASGRVRDQGTVGLDDENPGSPDEPLPADGNLTAWVQLIIHSLVINLTAWVQLIIHSLVIRGIVTNKFLNI
jgi:hypothetical protein